MEKVSNSVEIVLINDTLSSEHLRQLDCLYNAYNQQGNSEGDRRFYWAKIQQLTNSLTE